MARGPLLLLLLLSIFLTLSIDWLTGLRSAEHGPWTRVRCRSTTWRGRWCWAGAGARRGCAPAPRSRRTWWPRRARREWTRTGPRSGPCSCAASAGTSRDRRRRRSGRVCSARASRRSRSPRRSDPHPRYTPHSLSVWVREWVSGLVYIRWQWRNNRSTYMPADFGRHLLGKTLWEMFVTVIELKYALLASRWSYGHFFQTNWLNFIWITR